MNVAIDVVVPVYKGLAETRNCLESVLSSSNRAGFELVVINDCSPEPAVSAYLEEMARARKITLLANEKNLGFVQTVNRGMLLHKDRDVLLLNSDTIVANDWLDRIRACAYRGGKVGTVTPFSNNATICSYPAYCKPNAIPRGLTVAGIDRFFAEANSGASIEVPTAVGFCMYIRRACIEEIGIFDADTFGKGYGEENDFCMRAMKRGWKNVIAADAYVAHVGGVSFGEAQKALQARAAAALLGKHPEYDRLVAEHCAADPERPHRAAVDLLRLRRSPRPRILMVTHFLGGGTEKHVRELATVLSDRIETLALRPVEGAPYLQLEWVSPGESLTLRFHLGNQIPSLMALLRSIGISRVHFQHVIGLDRRFWSLPGELGVPYDFTAHDFYAICPRIHLISARNEYCGEPDEAGCNACLSSGASVESSDIRAWREGFRGLVEGAERVFAPSEYVAERIRKHFAGARLIVAHHPDREAGKAWPSPEPRRLAAGERLKIAVLGAIDAKKGSHLLIEAARDALARGLPLEFHLFGAIDPIDPIKALPGFVHHGKYRNEELDGLLASAGAHLAWFTARIPETYSYTLSEAFRNRLPVAAPELGSFTERLKGRAWTWLRPWTWGAREWNDEFVAIRGSFERLEAPAAPGALQPEPAFRYGGSYLQVGPRAGEGDPFGAGRLSPFVYGSKYEGLTWFANQQIRNTIRAVQRSETLVTLVKRIPPVYRARLKRLIFR